MLGIKYSRPVLTDAAVNTLFDTTLWLTRQYGATIKPKLPKALAPASPLRCWETDDPETVFNWAALEFTRLLSDMGMTEWAVQLLPDARRASRRDQHAVDSLRSRDWQAGIFPGYYIDNLGRPLFYYDPRRCSEPGYLQNNLVPKLAALKLMSDVKPASFQSEDLPQTIDYMSAHLGQGFALIARLEAVQSEDATPLSFLLPPPETEARDHLLFATVLGLAAHRYTPEQIIASYGPYMSPRTRKAVWPVYKALQKHADFLSLLQLMTQRRAKPDGSSHSVSAAHSRLHQAR